MVQLDSTWKVTGWFRKGDGIYHYLRPKVRYQAAASLCGLISFRRMPDNIQKGDRPPIAKRCKKCQKIRTTSQS